MPSSHQYGPHQPEAAPNAVTVLGPGLNFGSATYPQPEVRPIPPELQRQRERINTMAHEAALAESNHRLRDAHELARELAAGSELEAYPCSCGLWHFGAVGCDEGGHPVGRDE